MRRAHKGLLHYHNLVASGFDRGVLAYLDGVALSAGLRPFRGVVAEPWEREPPEDGTWAPVRHMSDCCLTLLSISVAVSIVFEQC